jgi:DNA-binding LytR/AlgR family response regulator
MTLFKAFIVDDEADACKLLEILLKDFSSIEVQQTYTEALPALKAAIREKPDIIFLDIDMPELNGLEYLKQLRNFTPATKVVFTTAYSQYALEALQNSAFDFICKPISTEELQRVTAKLVTHFLDGEQTNRQQSKQIMLKTMEGHHYINPDDVIYLEADGNYTSLVLRNDSKLLSSLNLGRVQMIFPKQQFIRISRKHVINKSFLTFINFGKKYCMVTADHKEIRLDISAKMKNLKAELEG